MFDVLDASIQVSVRNMEASLEVFREGSPPLGYPSGSAQHHTIGQSMSIIQVLCGLWRVLHITFTIWGTREPSKAPRLSYQAGELDR